MNTVLSTLGGVPIPESQFVNSSEDKSRDDEKSGKLCYALTTDSTNVLMVASI